MLSPLGGPAASASALADRPARVVGTEAAPRSLPRDTVSFSSEARMLLAVADMLAKAAGGPAPSVRLGDALARLAAMDAAVSAASKETVAGLEGSVAGALVAGGPGASLRIGIGGPNNDVVAFADGSDGDDTIAIAAETSGANPDSRASVRVRAGAGNDRVSVTSNGFVTVEGGDGDDVISTSNRGDLAGFNHADVDGGAGADVIRVTHNGHARGEAGDDTILLDYGEGWHATSAHGGDGNDLIVAVKPHVLAMGGDGNDTLVGASLVAGGRGDDLILLPNTPYSSVRVWEADFGNDTVVLSDPSSEPAGTAKLSFDTASYYPDGTRILPNPADAQGNYNGDYRSYLNTLPTEGQPGYGLAHTEIRFDRIRADQVEARLDGTDLTLRMRDTGSSMVIRNYQSGRVTFQFLDHASGRLTASRQPPGLTAVSSSAPEA